MAAFLFGKTNAHSTYSVVVEVRQNDLTCCRLADAGARLAAA